MISILACLLLAVSLQIIDYLYHRRDLDSLNILENTPFRELRSKLGNLSYQPLDNYLTFLPFIWTYLFIIAGIIAFNKFDSWIIRIALILFVTGRYRALQEIGHFAIHGVLCPNLKWGLFLANIFYQFPLFMPEAKLRRAIHARQHHNSVNMPHDPDLKELLNKDFIPGITSFQFWIGIFYPLTWRGIRDRIKECITYLIADRYSLNFHLRVICVSIIVELFLAFHQTKALIFLYVFPVLVIYPLFYWLAHVALHRWYAPCESNIAYYERELELGRPTEFKGILGFIIRHNIFPIGDSYHLAHSLFPIVRWTYLPQVDQILKKYFPKYSENMSCNLFFFTHSMPSAISELKDRMIKKES